jgi:small subunit ribosomal protein S20
VPTVKSAAKRMVQSAAARTRNRAWRSRLRTVVKRVRTAENAEQAEAALKAAIPIIDRTASQGIIHKNAAARTKSRLSAHVKGLAEQAA